MRALFRPEARAEALEARTWYESRSVGLGLEFARSLDAALASALRHPDSYKLVGASCRQVLLRRFPYSVVYRARKDEFLVVAVFHHRRNPSILSRRIGA